jgi:N6-L-threonylcarbamoyladenine synthase
MMKQDPLILAFDTSCDETSVAVVKGRSVLSNVISSQVELHKKWGGVVPMIARRAHEENLQPSLKEALKRARILITDVDYIACTYGPGLALALEVGLDFSKKLALKYNLPFVLVNHMEGHLLSSFALNSKGKGKITNTEKIFPVLGLLISGAHTELVLMNGFCRYQKLGQTLDDAAGEAFDKVGRMLNLGYPGGPIVSEFAKKGTKDGAKEIGLPVPLQHSEDLNFSYSGLKTASLYKIKKLREHCSDDKVWVYDFCRSFVDSIVASLKNKVVLAFAQCSDIKTFILGGGVVNNEKITRTLGLFARQKRKQYFIPHKELRTDNAAMIGVAAYYNILNNKNIIIGKDIQAIDRDPISDIFEEDCSGTLI